MRSYVQHEFLVRHADLSIINRHQILNHTPGSGDASIEYGHLEYVCDLREGDSSVMVLYLQMSLQVVGDLLQVPRSIDRGVDGFGRQTSK